MDGKVGGEAVAAFNGAERAKQQPSAFPILVRGQATHSIDLLDRRLRGKVGQQTNLIRSLVQSTPPANLFP